MHGLVWQGGAAWAGGTSDAQAYYAPERFLRSGTRWGWMAGTGLEYAFGPKLSGFVEYDHLDFGTRNGDYTNQFGDTSVAGFNQRLDLVRMGVNYRPGLGGANRDATSDAAPALPGGWTMEVGSRYFGSSGRMQKDLYDPGRTSQVNSRLIYGDQTGHAAETFFRFDHRSGLFARGNFGLGNLVDGKLSDEDFFREYIRTPIRART